MNPSLNKLFNSQKSSSVHYSEVDVIEAPVCKKLVDARLLFERSVELYNISDSAESFKYYTSAYVFAIDSILNKFSSIQRRISAQGANSENIKEFKNFVSQRRDSDFIVTLYLQFSTKQNCYWKSFVRGFRDAERAANNICNYIEREQASRQLTNAMIYTSFWELTSRERIVLPENF